MKRYEVIGGSVSGHCCFEASVIDTTNDKPLDDGIVCECFRPQDAERICAALNALDEQMKEAPHKTGPQ